MVSHALSPVVHILKGLYFGATRAWHIQHEFSDRRCDVVCVWYNDKFLTRSCNIKSNLSSFQSLAPVRDYNYDEIKLNLLLFRVQKR